MKTEQAIQELSMYWFNISHFKNEWYTVEFIPRIDHFDKDENGNWYYEIEEKSGVGLKYLYKHCIGGVWIRKEQIITMLKVIKDPKILLLL